MVVHEFGEYHAGSYQATCKSNKHLIHAKGAFAKVIRSKPERQKKYASILRPMKSMFDFDEFYVRIRVAMSRNTTNNHRMHKPPMRKVLLRLSAQGG